MEIFTAASVLLFLVGAALSFGLSWSVLSGRFSRKLQSFEQELQDHKNNLSQAKNTRVSLEKDLAQNRDDLKTERGQVLDLTRQVSQWETSHRNLQQKLNEQKQEVEELNKKFTTEFKNLANEIFEEKSKKFTTQNKENLGELLNPLREKISEFQKKVEDSHLAGEKRSSALGVELKNLKELNQQITQEAKSLTLALRGDSKTQGSWGEMQLEAILEKAGLQKDIHYFKERNLKTEEGANQRLDYVINLPDGKHLILDSKVSLSAYSRYFDTDDETEKAAQLKAHVNSIYAHIKLLGEKNYQNLYDINTPDYVMMFVANEPALTMALREDPQLYEKALAKNIALVSTTTLLATLRTISYIWKQDLQNKNAEEIARQAGAMFDKFEGFTKDLMKLGKDLDTAQNTYKASMNKLVDGRGNLVKSSQKLRELGAKSTKDLDQRLLDRAD